MRLLISLTITYVFILFFAGITVSAQESSLEIIGEPTSQKTGSDNKVIAKQTSEWLVKKLYKANGFPSGECIIKTTYDNNIAITFKAKNRQLSALRVKDMTNNPHSDIKGFIGLGLGKNSYGLQSKSQTGQIDASLLTVPAPSDKLLDVNDFRLRLGMNDYYFSTDGFAPAYKNLMDCIGQQEPATIPVVNEHRLNLAETNKQDMPEYHIPLMPVTPIDPVTEDIIEDKAVTDAKEPIDTTQDILPEMVETTETDNAPVKLMPSAPSSPTLKDSVWKAVKGKSLKTTLQTWSDVAGVNLDMQLDNDVTIPHDMLINAPIDIAVSQLLQDIEKTGVASFNAGIKPSTNSAIIPVIDGQDTAPAQAALTPMAPTTEQAPATTMAPAIAPYQWKALQGTDVRRLLNRWATREDIDLIWNTDKFFLVKDSITNATNFNQAVAMLLDQFKTQEIKPMAVLNTDPNTGKTALIVTTK